MTPALNCRCGENLIFNYISENKSRCFALSVQHDISYWPLTLDVLPSHRTLPPTSYFVDTRREWK